MKAEDKEELDAQLAEADLIAVRMFAKPEPGSAEDWKLEMAPAWWHGDEEAYMVSSRGPSLRPPS